jgi:hypothetical protein
MKYWDNEESKEKGTNIVGCARNFFACPFLDETDE